jgi:8-oxo-dGTP pyrophosphatase MutT (NUDIX family)
VITAVPPTRDPVNRLQHRLQQQTFKRFHSPLAPSLAYGRHRGPSSLQSRIAAVTIALYPDAAGRWVIPLTVRPDFLQHHGGQICLPGGRLEPGETVLEAALREFEEELGVRPAVITQCGELSTQYVYGSNNLVHPVVVAVEPPEGWVPDPQEVAEVIVLPIEVLTSDSSRSVVSKQKDVVTAAGISGRLSFRAPTIQFGEYQIWGATALILDELAHLLQT